MPTETFIIVPQIYACVYCTDATTGNQSVLVTKKRVQARWLNWNGTGYDVPFQNPAVQVPNRVPYDIASNPGQPVIPGGELTTGKPEMNEAIFRFWEQTGIDLASLYPGRSMPAPSYPHTIKRFTGQEQPALQDQPFVFSAVYFEFPQALYQAAYMQAFTNILYNNLESRPPNTAKDELDFICSLPVADARQWFTDANDDSCKRRSTDRFNVILDNMP